MTADADLFAARREAPYEFKVHHLRRCLALVPLTSHWRRHSSSPPRMAPAASAAAIISHLLRSARFNELCAPASKLEELLNELCNAVSASFD